jgi:hypothetical protein
MAITYVPSAAIKGGNLTVSLFQQGNFRLHSGSKSWFKIECAFLAPEDWVILASLISRAIKFKEVIGVPTGGLKLAEALKFYRTMDDHLPTLIVDDVLTTGRSMEKERARIKGETIGVVLFARGDCPEWIIPIFTMTPTFIGGL